MSKTMMRVWGFLYVIVFQCARIAFMILRPRIRGTMVAIWCRGRILMVQNSYRKHWTLPGGMAKRRETVVQAAVRETLEEVGIQLEEERLVLIGEARGDFGPRDRTHLFEVKVDHPVDVVIDGREVVHAEFVTLDEALNRSLHANVRMLLRQKPKK